MNCDDKYPVKDLIIFHEIDFRCEKLLHELH